MELLIVYSFWTNQIDGFFNKKYLKELKPMVFKIRKIPQQ